MPRPTDFALTREPNVVPMIDILLVLLIIFMLANALVRQTVDLQLPEDAASVPGPPPLVLEVRPGPTYALNGQEFGASELHDRIARAYDGRPDKVLFVRGDPTVRYQDVISALDGARGAGVRVQGAMLPR
jgi:biopolymer transport protein TolR